MLLMAKSGKIFHVRSNGKELTQQLEMFFHNVLLLVVLRKEKRKTFLMVSRHPAFFVIEFRPLWRIRMLLHQG